MKAVEGWKQISIGEFVDLINGFAFPSEGFTEGEGKPLIRIRDLERQKTEVNFRGKYNEHYLVKKEDLLIGMDGDFQTVKWKGSNALLNQRVCKLITKSPKVLVQDFLFYRIIEEILHIHRITAATTVKHLSSKDVLGIKIDLPSKPEQTKIAEVLSTVDREIEQTEALIAKQQHIKIGLMQDLLTRGIDEHGNLRSEQAHEFKDSPLGRIPVEWEVGTLSDIANINPKSDISQLSDNSLVTFLSMPDVGENGKIISRQIQKLSKVKTGFTRFTEQDILFAKITPCMENGKGALATELINKIGFGSTEFHVLRANKSGNPEFIYHITQSKKFRLKSEGHMTGSAGQRRVPANFFQKFRIHLPPLSEQHHIAGILTAADQRVEKEEAYRNKLLQIKKGLMQDLLIGKKRVTALLKDTEEITS